MTVDSIMTREVVTVQGDTALTDLRALLHDRGFRHLLVVDNGDLMGVISDRDLIRELSPWLGSAAETRRDVATLNRRAHQVMSRRPVTAAPGDSVASACARFIDEDVSCLPVVDEANRPVGIVTWRDLLVVLARVASRAG